MKKSLLGLSLIVGIASINTANAVDGNVQFTGEIIDSACTVDTTSANQTVILGQVAKTAFKAAGDTAAATSFSIKLNNCPTTVTSATVKFDGTPYNGDNTVLALTAAAGNATGVGVQLSNSDGSVLPLLTASESYPLSATAANTLNFSARYIAKAAAVTTGPANAAASFTIVYN